MSADVLCQRFLGLDQRFRLVLEPIVVIFQHFETFLSRNFYLLSELWGKLRFGLSVFFHDFLSELLGLLKHVSRRWLPVNQPTLGRCLGPCHLGQEAPSAQLHLVHGDRYRLLLYLQETLLRF